MSNVGDTERKGMEPGSPAGPSGVVEAFNMGRNEDAEVEEPTMR